MGEFDFTYEADQNDDRHQKDEARKGHPIITYHLGVSDGAKPGFFTINMDVTEKPGPFWVEDSHRFGRDPNASPTPVWATQRLRAIFIADRTRMVVRQKVGDRTNAYYYPHKTKREDRVEGKLSIDTQLLLVFPDLGIEQPRVLSLGGLARQVSWMNDLENDYHKPNFPPGIYQKLGAYVDKASESVGAALPFYACWIIDLVPVFKNGQPYWVDIGYGTFANPLTLDMTVKSTAQNNQDGYPERRFITGKQNQDLKDYYSGVAKGWVAEWDSFDGSSVNEEAYSTHRQAAAEPVGVDNDPIPF